jgi:DNA-binding CsgD family transcriptional regulator
MIANRVPGGILEASTEFFTVFSDEKAQAMCMHAGSKYDFDHAPQTVKSIVATHIKRLPVLNAALTKMVGNDETLKVKQCIICRYGALNNEADIDANGTLSEPEYVPCNKRGVCKFEGTVCCAITVNGTPLSKAETSVFKLVEYTDNVIADKLFLSDKTVKKHFNNIRIKTGFANKIQMAIWATQRGII